MQELFDNFVEEACNILQLMETFDNALLYCNDRGLDTAHLQTLSEYICKRMGRFVHNYDKAIFKYYGVCNKQDY